MFPFDDVIMAELSFDYNDYNDKKTNVKEKDTLQYFLWGVMVTI